MKKLFALGALLAAGVAIAMQIGPPIRGEWAPDKVAEDVYVIHGPLGVPTPENQGFMNNPAFIVGDDGVVVVDPGSSLQVGEMLLERIGQVTDKPVVAVFNSHIHGDHWLGNQAIRARYPDVPIYGHERVGPKIVAGVGTQWVQLMLDMTQKATAGTRIVKPDHPVSDGDVIDAAGLTFRIFNNDKAHTDTDIMLLVEEKQVMFLGDNAGHERILRLEGGSFRGNVAALETALQTGAKVFIPGHGPTAGTEAASLYRDYLQTVYATVAAGYSEGKADFEIRPDLLPKLDAWKGWEGFDNLLGAHISAAYLEAEAADFE
jgi:glyoxylase-like metal-dependent hydrolase (beta-lactamase superfamily II)